MESGTSSFLYGIWGSAWNDIYAVGDSGTVLHCDGASWSPGGAGTNENLRDVWGSSGTNVFTAGSVWIRHYDGAGWSIVYGGSDYFKAVWGSAANDVLFVGYAGAVFHYDGLRLFSIGRLTLNELTGIWGSSASDIFVVGASGTILHYDGDYDSDGILDVDDKCPDIFSQDQTDTDNDALGDICDNCPMTPNLNQVDSDVSGIGDACNDAIDADGDEWEDTIDNCVNISNFLQEDSFPPQGNALGNACDCEGNFNCSEDRDVDGGDAALFKADFGRRPDLHPCVAGDTCNGDFTCDGDVDGTDASLFKADFGRSSMQNPCPVCTLGVEWCQYQ
jgi:hypothetical protein